MTNTASDKPLSIAHRGAANLWPENTLYAFERAIAAGVDGIELDVQLSADGRLMVHHDAQLKPEATQKDGQFLTAPTPRLDALTTQELAAYEVGQLQADSPYGARRQGRENKAGLTIPSLAGVEALIAATAKPDFRLYCELKTDMRADPQQSLRLADAYLAALESSPIAAQHIVISFDWRCLARVRAARPDIAHAYTTMAFTETDPDHPSAAHDKGLAAAIRAASRGGAPWWDGADWRDQPGKSHGEKVLRAIQAQGGRGWFAEQSDITAENMALADRLGLAVGVWTVNRPDAMRHCARLGVAAIITDRPDILSDI